MSSLQILNSGAQNVRQKQALAININAARSLQNLLKTNLGPRGTLKMLVGGGGDIKVTKDGNVLLKNMQISHPTAALIARTAISQDKMTGDGTTSTVLITGELLYQSYSYLLEGVHPTAIIEGIEIALEESKKFLTTFSQKYKKKNNEALDKETLINVARTSLRTKIENETADKLATIVVDAIEVIRRKNEKQIDLFMVEIQEQEHLLYSDCEFIKGIVLDHGPRHPDMKRDLSNCYILTCNVSLEYEKSDVNSKFMYSDANERQALIEAERKQTDDKVKKIIELKKELCDKKLQKGEKKKNFVLINQKGIDPMSLDLLAKAGITALRRAKRRNMERLTLACGGKALNSFEDITASDLGYAERVHEVTVGEEKFTYVDGVKNPYSCTILIKGQNSFTIKQIKDAIRDGLRAVKNAIEDNCVLPGGGAFEIALHNHLSEYARKKVKGKPSLGVKCFAEALLIVPKTLANNSGLDPLDCVLELQQEYEAGNVVGLDVYTGDPMDPMENGIFDNSIVKRQILETCMYTASQLLHIDEIMKSGRGKKGGQQLG